MRAERVIPWSGLTLAALTTFAAMFAGLSLWLGLGMLIVWIGTLWLTQPQPSAERITSGKVALSRETMREVIEPLGAPLIVFDGQKIVAASASAKVMLGSHIVGQDGRIALRHPKAIQLLDMADGASVTISGFPRQQSLSQLTRQRIDDDYWVIEILDRTSESDVSRAHTDFVANASHELRTPLAVIIGYVETLMDKAREVDWETTDRFQGTVLREAKRMQNLVSDLLSLSHLEAGKHDVPDAVVDMLGLAKTCIADTSGGTGDSRLNLHCTEPRLDVKGEAADLQQLVRNLMDNGLKYGDSAKPVDIRLEKDLNWAKLTVTDYGAGIEPHHVPLLTRRFYRADPGRSRAAGGTGLGLAIVKHIVERHRGKLDIASILGTGTTVTVRLPLSDTSAKVS